jgi:class 3 adenylate cyclase/CheY-like chemotaxis protein
MNETRTIVIAEDSRTQGLVLKKALESRGHVVHWGHTGAEALDLARRHRPDLVVSDVEMPELDGHELCRAIKADRDLRATPVLLLTSLAKTSDILAGLRNGADAYVTKPYDPPQVIDRIDHLLAHAAAADSQGERLTLEYDGETMHLDVTRRQLLNLLLSTYENVIWQNGQLAEMRDRLEDAGRQLTSSLARTRDLLHLVLPREIADELTEHGRSEPRHFDAATVLFADFVGFTKLAETMRPRDLVDNLDDYFRRFDTLAAECRMEKLKTIGDAYMAAGGVPRPNVTHAVDAALLGLALRRCVADVTRERGDRGLPSFAIRIGLHTGPLVAGVVGTQRFSYDVWGDTVNTASRMETASESGRINVSDAVQRHLEPWFVCVPRGRIEVKNRGAVEMFFLERLKPEFSADAEGTTGNERFTEAYGRLGQP